ncbi:MAG: enoyl-CoA hydratase [Motiliproteus sp.]|nr:enoyl-CoA hydratase [Motiliproteus sp.]MCW9051973.1 enoyl-CoA hydratase [Motiliproteus sp.]
MTELVTLYQQGAVLQITLQRPEKKNALNQAMYLQLTAALEQAADDKSVGAVLITGSSDSFSSGNDLADFVAMADKPEGLAPVMEFLHRLAAFPKPMIAAVNGLAIGIGTTMLLHCDLVYACPEAKFQLPFVDLGLVPEGGSSLLLPNMLGHQKASELLLLAERFNAETAYRLGLVNQLVNVDELQHHAMEQAEKLASKPPLALQAAKQMIKSHRQMGLSEVIDIEGREFATKLKQQEARAALAAFLQRR